MLRKLLFIFILISFFCEESISQNIIPAGKEANFVNYDSEAGLPSNEVCKVYESSKGYIWACCKGGVTKFDGINLQTFTEKDGLPAQSVLAACEDNNGNMWFGTNKGLALLKDNKIITFDSTYKLPKNVRSISKFKDGTFWIASTTHVFHIDPNNLKNPFIKKYKPNENIDRFIFRDIWQNKKGEIIVGCDYGCFYLRNDSLVRYNDMATAAYQMVEMENGEEWFCAWQEPIRVYKNGKAAGKIDLGSGTLSMIKDSKGNVWVVTWDQGVFKYDGKNFIHYSTKEGLYFNCYWGVNEDSNGNIWFSSWGAGIFKYSGEAFTRLTEKSGLQSNNTNNLLLAPDGKIWITTDQSVTSYDPITKKITQFTECNGKKLSLVMNLYAKSANEIWCMGYLGKGYKIIDNKIVEVDSLAGFDVEHDAKGNIWIATDDRGLVRINGSEKKTYDTRSIHGTSRLVFLFRDKKDNMWIINEQKGIDLFYNDEVININTKNNFFNEPAMAITQDAEGFYWISVTKRGVYKCLLLEGNKINILDSITPKDGLSSDKINSLVVSNRILYMASNKGLMSYDTKQLKKVVEHYGKEDGLLNLDCAVFFADKNSNIWLATPKGIYCFDPSQKVKNKKETATHITSVKLFFEDTDWLLYGKGYDKEDLPADLVLPYQKNHLTFNFIGVNMLAPTKVLYQYKLEGLDEEWLPTIDKREATYSNIPPGTYTFVVKSCNGDGVWNEKPVSFSFTISPPFWKTIWFYSICVTGLLLILFSFIKYREKKLQKEKVVLEEKINERTHQLQDAFKQIEEKQKEITDSISYASKIQSALMPTQKELLALAYDSFILFKPKDIVSGDFYWSERNENRTYLALCDSTGHGVPGAFMSLLNINYINKAINELNISEPNEIFNSVRTDLVYGISKEGQKDGFDGVLFCFDKKYNEVTYTAANNRPILISNNTVTNLPHDKMPVGKGEKENSFTLNKIAPLKGDALYLFTDGFIDQFGGPKGKKFMYKQLEEFLLSIHHLPFSEQKKILDAKFEGWKGDLEQVDDVTIIGMRI